MLNNISDEEIRGAFRKANCREARLFSVRYLFENESLEYSGQIFSGISAD